MAQRPRCTECRKRFTPEVTTGDRQKACGPECRLARRRKRSRARRRRDDDGYRAAERVRQGVHREKQLEASGCHAPDPGPWPCDTTTTDDWVADPSVGITAGVNIWCHGMHCVAGLVDLQSGGVADYAAVSFGLAYHL